MICQRCGTESDRLYDTSQENDFGDLITLKLCWSCNHDVINGGDLFEDSWEVLADRAENDYAYDPINNERPW